MRPAAMFAALLLPLACGADDLLGRLASPDPAARVAQIDEAVRSHFDEALQEYAVYIGRNPHDIVARIDRCRFMDEFASTYEYASFADTIYELADDCREEIEGEYSGHSEVQLYRIEQAYGDERLELAEQALAKTGTQDWSSAQLSRLYVILANATEQTDGPRSLAFARKALEHDEAADVRIQVASRLLEQGKRDEVVRTLVSPLDGHDKEDTWYAANKMRLLAEAGSKEHVLALYATLRDEESGYDGMTVTRALRQVGAIDEARESFSRLAEQGVQGPGVAAQRFRFEMSHGKTADALVAYDQWRDAGWLEDPIGINRIALALRDPWLPWKARDLLGLVGLLLAIAAVAAVVALPIACVHYRGLARRAARSEPYPVDGWRLRQAWFALFAFNLASIIALYCVGPLDVTAESGIWGLDASSEQIAKMAVVNTLLVIALLLPLAFAARRVWPSWQSSTWSAWRSARVGAAIGVIFRLPLALAWLSSGGDLEGARGQDALWQMLVAVREEFGIVTAFWVVVVFAPVIEEFLFRGVLLNAFAAHVKFGWANFIQAAMFAAIHMDLRASVSLFLLGFIAGSLTRRSGGLLAAMVLHATFNVGATLLFISS